MYLLLLTAFSLYSSVKAVGVVPCVTGKPFDSNCRTCPSFSKLSTQNGWSETVTNICFAEDGDGFRCRWEKQIRVKDKGWSEILGRLRVGECGDNDVEEIQELVLSHPECDVPNFQEKPWSEAILVTSRHGVREAWNDEALARHCNQTGHIRYIVAAEDVDRNTGEEPLMRVKLAIAGSDPGKAIRLSEHLQVAVGMKAMVLLNIATEADIANGTRGVIEDIILDEREERAHKPGVDGTIKLKFPPAMLLFQPDKPTQLRFEGIQEGLIPITPSEASFIIKNPAKRSEYKIKRRQYAITGGYAFTDYKSQGQTIEYVIIDIAKPPTGQLSPFGVYVSLSRSRGRDTIRLLRDFDKELFQHYPSESLRLDMIRLRHLNKVTKDKWEQSQVGI